MNKQNQSNQRKGRGARQTEAGDTTMEAGADTDVDQAQGEVSEKGAQRASQAEGVLPQALSDNLPAESREQIEQLLSDARSYADEARVYIRQNPVEAAGLIAAAAAVLWVLFGTKPGRRVLDAGTSYGMPIATKWVKQNFAAKIAEAVVH